MPRTSCLECNNALGTKWVGALVKISDGILAILRVFHGFTQHFEVNLGVVLISIRPQQLPFGSFSGHISPYRAPLCKPAAAK